jgi:hypothetical protein
VAVVVVANIAENSLLLLSCTDRLSLAALLFNFNSQLYIQARCRPVDGRKGRLSSEMKAPLLLQGPSTDDSVGKCLSKVALALLPPSASLDEPEKEGTRKLALAPKLSP